MAEGRALRSRHVIGLVARREVGERMRARSFLVSTVLLIVLVLAIGIVNRIAADDGPSTLDVGIGAEHDDTVVGAFEAVGAAVERDVSVTFYDDADAARAALEEDEVDVVVDPGPHQVLFAEEVDDQTLALVQQTWAQISVRTQLAEAGLGADQVDQAMSVAPLEVDTLDGADDDIGLAILIGTVSAILLFMSLQTFGSYVLTGVVEEKASAVVEILLVRAQADQLLAGKVLGIGAAALTQFAAVVAAALVSLSIADVDVPWEIWTSVPMMLVWFLGGFTMYSTLYALAGSLVSRQEDAQAAAAPISYSLVAAYLLVFLFGYIPDSTPSTILSLLPPTAPFLMPMRMAAGAASPIEVAVAVLGLVLATAAAWQLASRIYVEVLLRRGARIGWRDALSLLRRPA